MNAGILVFVTAAAAIWATTMKYRGADVDGTSGSPDQLSSSHPLKKYHLRHLG